MIGTHESPIATISKRRNDQTSAVSEILERVEELSIYHFDGHWIFGIVFIDPIVSHLSNPIELLNVITVVIYQRLNDILVMDIDGD